MNKYIKPSILAVILLLLISGYALFCEPLIGLADNGDFFRVMISNDLKHQASWSDNELFGYFDNEYDKLQYYNDSKVKIISTHNIIVRAAIFLDDIFTGDKKFDIRFLAILCLAVLSLSVYWMVEVAESMTDNKKLKYILSLTAVVIFGDIGYTSYFNSFYGEAIAYSFYILSISALLNSILKEEDIKAKYLIIFFTSTLIFIGSKNQFAPNGIIAFILLLSLLFFKIGNSKKILSVILGGVLLASAITFFMVIDDNIYWINKYQMVTRGVMLFEPDVQKVTKEVGINEQYSLLEGTIYYDRTPVIDPMDELLIVDFYSRYNLVSVAIYYLKNPKAFSKMMELGWKNSFTIRPEVLGNYSHSSGREFGERTSFFSSWSYFKDNCIPHYPGLIYIFLAICVVLSISRMLRYRQGERREMIYCFEIIMLYIFLTGFSQILVSFIGAGDADLKKHLFITSVSLDLLFYFNLAYAVSIFYKKEDAKLSRKRDY